MTWSSLGRCHGAHSDVHVDTLYVERLSQCCSHQHSHSQTLLQLQTDTKQERVGFQPIDKNKDAFLRCQASSRTAIRLGFLEPVM